jgi:hypothetical protein
MPPATCTTCDYTITSTYKACHPYISPTPTPCPTGYDCRGHPYGPWACLKHMPCGPDSNGETCPSDMACQIYIPWTDPVAGEPVYCMRGMAGCNGICM